MNALESHSDTLLRSQVVKPLESHRIHGRLGAFSYGQCSKRLMHSILYIWDSALVLRLLYYWGCSWENTRRGELQPVFSVSVSQRCTAQPKTCKSFHSSPLNTRVTAKNYWLLQKSPDAVIKHQWIMACAATSAQPTCKDCAGEFK